MADEKQGPFVSFAIGPVLVDYAEEARVGHEQMASAFGGLLAGLEQSQCVLEDQWNTAGVLAELVTALEDEHRKFFGYVEGHGTICEDQHYSPPCKVCALLARHLPPGRIKGERG